MMNSRLETKVKFAQNYQVENDSRKTLEEKSENTPKLKLDLNVFKSRDIESTRQYAELQRIMGKNRADVTPSRSAIECGKQDSIVSLKNSMKIRFKEVDNTLKFNEKEEMVKEGKLTINFKSKHSDGKLPSGNPSFVNTSENTARRKSQVYILEQPELTDRSREVSKDPGVHKKAISYTRTTPPYRLQCKAGDKMEDNSIFSLTSETKIEKKNESINP
jgi:hypothetical protein